MGELARIRSTRDLRISRGHLAAAAVGAVLLAVTAFALGTSMADRSSPSATPRAFTAEVPGDELVELLARIDASSLADGGAGELTYQDDLRKPSATFTGAPAPIEAPAAANEPVRIDAGAAQVPAVADTPPSGSLTVWVAERVDPEEARNLRDRLRKEGLPAWIAPTLGAGITRYTIAVGGYTSEAEATEAAALVRQAGGAAADVRTLAKGAIGASDAE